MGAHPARRRKARPARRRRARRAASGQHAGRGSPSRRDARQLEGKGLVLVPAALAGRKRDDASLVDSADGQLQLLKNVNFLRLEFTDVEGGTHGVGAPITDWKPGEWHQVAGSWDVNVVQLYLDGQLVRETSIGSVLLLPEKARLRLGSAFPPNRPTAPGLVGGLELPARPPSPGERMDPS